MNLEKSLRNIGLTEAESRAYGAFVELQKATGYDVARLSGIKRSTVYGILDSLVKKKLIAVTQFRGVKDYRILSFEHVRAFVRNQERKLTPYLYKMKKLYESRERKAKLRIYEGETGVKTLLEKVLREKSKLRIFGDEKVFRQHLAEFWDSFLKRSQQLGVYPAFKAINHPVQLMIWSDKAVFLRFGNNPRALGFKHREFSSEYLKLWNHF